MITACPECGKRYRLPDDAVPPEGRSVRCAACRHGWTAYPPPLPPAQSDLPFAPAARAPRVAELLAADAAAPAVPEAEAPAPRRRRWRLPFALAVLLAAAVGLGLFVAPMFPPPDFIAGRLPQGLPTLDLPRLDLPRLDLPRIDLPPLDLTRVPLVGDTLDGLVNPPPPPVSLLRLTGRGVRHTLANGTLLLEVAGTVTNPTPAPQAVPAIAASLLDPAGHVAVRWRIPPPVATLAPGEARDFASTAANFPPAATVLRLHVPAR